MHAILLKHGTASFILLFCCPLLFFGLDKNLKVANEVLMAFCLIVSVKAKGKPEEGGKVKFTAIICGRSQCTQHQVSSDWPKGKVVRLSDNGSDEKKPKKYL